MRHSTDDTSKSTQTEENAIDRLTKKQQQHTKIPSFPSFLDIDTPEAMNSTENSFVPKRPRSTVNTGSTFIPIFYGVGRHDASPDLKRSGSTGLSHYRIEETSPTGISQTPGFSTGKNSPMDEAMLKTGAQKAILIDDSSENIQIAREHDTTHHGRIIGTIQINTIPNAPFPMQQFQLLLQKHSTTKHIAAMAK